MSVPGSASRSADRRIAAIGFPTWAYQIHPGRRTLSRGRFDGYDRACTSGRNGSVAPDGGRPRGEVEGTR